MREGSHPFGREPFRVLRRRTNRPYEYTVHVPTPVEGALSARGIEFGAVSSDGMLKIAHFADPDGNPLYLCEQPKLGRLSPYSSRRRRTLSM